MAKSVCYIWLEEVDVPSCTWTPQLLSVNFIIKFQFLLLGLHSQTILKKPNLCNCCFIVLAHLSFTEYLIVVSCNMCLLPFQKVLSF